jgi:hypothetical protein
MVLGHDSGRSEGCLNVYGPRPQSQGANARLFSCLDLTATLALSSGLRLCHHGIKFKKANEVLSKT